MDCCGNGLLLVRELQPHGPFFCQTPSQLLFITALVRLQGQPPPMVTRHCWSFWSHLMPAWPLLGPSLIKAIEQGLRKSKTEFDVFFFGKKVINKRDQEGKRSHGILDSWDRFVTEGNLVLHPSLVFFLAGLMIFDFTCCHLITDAAISAIAKTPDLLVCSKLGLA
ncbi:hypothetical protein NE237_030873 [Protea cynaroides]|uniref:Uncharacterized protein n=1 Tax=Protea cynaroides TaxID=273540 RepID=A0A9Q0GVV4_9MAGN|nr:hypothetical protein NE237_030873 [Protea cynaroides]